MDPLRARGRRSATGRRPQLTAGPRGRRPPHDQAFSASRWRRNRNLTAEAFAGALASSRRFRPGRKPAVAWPYGIVNNKLAAIRSHILDERGYEEVAGNLACSEVVARQRVSRGPQTLRVRFGKESP